MFEITFEITVYNYTSIIPLGQMFEGSLGVVEGSSGVIGAVGSSEPWGVVGVVGSRLGSSGFVEGRRGPTVAAVLLSERDCLY